MNLSAAAPAAPKGLQPWAVNQQDARRRFIDRVEEAAGLTDAQAYELAALYQSNGVLWLCPTTGQFHLQHGALLNPDVIAQALAGRLFLKQES